MPSENNENVAVSINADPETMSYKQSWVNYFKNKYPYEAVSGIGSNMVVPVVLIDFLKQYSPATAEAIVGFFLKDVLGPVMGDYAPLGFPVLNVLLGATFLVVLGKTIDTAAEKVGLMQKLQEIGWLPKAGDTRITLFYFPLIPQPLSRLLPFDNKKEAGLFIGLQTLLLTTNSALQMFTQTRDAKFSQGLNAAYSSWIFGVFIPTIMKFLFEMAKFVKYFFELSNQIGVKNAASFVLEAIGNKSRDLVHSAARFLPLRSAVETPLINQREGAVQWHYLKR